MKPDSILKIDLDEFARKADFELTALGEDYEVFKSNIARGEIYSLRQFLKYTVEPFLKVFQIDEALINPPVPLEDYDVSKAADIREFTQHWQRSFPAHKISVDLSDFISAAEKAGAPSEREVAAYKNVVRQLTKIGINHLFANISERLKRALLKIILQAAFQNVRTMLGDILVVVTALEHIDTIETLDYDAYMAELTQKIKQIEAQQQKTLPVALGPGQQYKVFWNGSETKLSRISRHLYSKKAFRKPNDFERIFTEQKAVKWMGDIDSLAYLLFKLHATPLQAGVKSKTLISAQKDGKNTKAYLKAICLLLSDNSDTPIDSRVLADRSNKIQRSPAKHPKTVAFVNEALKRLSDNS